VNFEIFCLHLTWYLNRKESFPICMFVLMPSGKCELHTYFTFLQRIQTYTRMKNLIFFCILYVAMSNIHFSGLDNVKMTFQTHSTRHIRKVRAVWSVKKIYSLDIFFIDGFSFIQTYFTFLHNRRSLLSTSRNAAPVSLIPLHRSSPPGN